MQKKKKEPRIERSVANFTEDLIIEILLCLPAKSIARFRCVCKSWNNLLTHDTSFTEAKRHHDTRKGNFKLLQLLAVRKFHQNYEKDIYNMRSRSVISDEAVYIRYPFQKQSYKDIQILGSCNGLICAATNGGYIIYVWNPCTKEYKLILSENKPTAFRANKNFVNHDYIGYGFGYDSKTSDYKFVAIFSDHDTNVSGVEIYNLGSDSWKTYRSCIPYIVPRGNFGVFLNGALHWLANTDNNTQSRRVILSFDIEDEKFKEIPQPLHMVDDFEYRFVGVLRGCLCLFCSVSKVGFEIWEMKNYGVRESWSKLFKTDQKLMTKLDIPSYRYLRSAVSLQNGETLLHVRLDGEMHPSYWQKRFNVVKICLEENARHRNIRKYSYKKCMVQMVPYMESLVSVRTGTRVGGKQEREDYDIAIRGLESVTF